MGKQIFQCMLVLLLSLPAQVAPFWPSYDFGKSIEDLINRQIQGSIKIESWTYEPPKRLILKKTKLLDKKGQIIIAANLLEANISLSDFMRGRLVFDQVKGHGVDLRLNYSNGYFNIEKAFESRFKNNKKSDIHVELRDLMLKNSRLHLGTPDVKLTVSQLSFEGLLTVLKNKLYIEAYDLKTQTGFGSIAGVEFEIKDLQLQNGQLRHNELFVKAANGILNQGPFKAMGKIHFGQEKFALKGYYEGLAGQWFRGLQVPPFDIPNSKSTFELTGTFLQPVAHFQTQFEKTRLGNVEILRGMAKGELTRQHIKVHQGMLYLPQLRHEAKGSFLYHFEPGDYEGQVNLLPLPVTKVLTFLEVSSAQLSPLSGKMGGEFQFIFQPQKNPFVQIKAAGQIEAGTRFLEFQVPKQAASWNMMAQWDKDQDIFYIEKVQVKHGNSSLEAFGDLYRYKQHQDLNLHYQMQISNLDAWLVHKRKAEVNLKVQGDLQKKGPKWNSKGQVTGQGFLQGMPIQLTKTHWKLDSPVLQLEVKGGRLALGALLGTVLFDFQKNQIKGQLGLSQAQLDTGFLAYGKNWPIWGKVDMQMQLSGSLKTPRLQGMLQGTQGRLASHSIHLFKTKYDFYKGQLAFYEASLKSPFLDLESLQLEIPFKGGDYRGEIAIEKLNMKGFDYLSTLKLLGEGKGKITLSGSQKQPLVKAWLNVLGVSMSHQNLGSGPVKLYYGFHKPHQISLVAQLKETLPGEAQKITFVRLGYENGQINGELKGTRWELLPFTLEQKALLPLAGLGEIQVRMQGSLENPHVVGHVQVQEVQSVSVQKEPKLGAMESHFELENHQLVGNLRFAEQYLELRGRFKGFLDYEVETKGQLKGSSYPLWIRFLYEEGAQVLMEGSFHMRLTKAPKHPLKARGDLNLNAFKLGLPGLSDIILLKPITLEATESRLKIKEKVALSLGEQTLSLKGFLGLLDWDFTFDGAMPLLFSKLLISDLVKAQGSVYGNMRVFGSSAHPLLEGHMAFLPNSSFKLSKYLEEIEIAKGSIHFTADRNRSLVRMQVSDLQALVGEGQATLEGALSAVSTGKGKWQLLDPQLRLFGNGILMKSGANNTAETNLDLRFEKIQNKNWMVGSIFITDGQWFSGFSMNQFSLVEKGPKNDFHIPSWMKDVYVNVDFFISSFLAQFSTNIFGVRAYLKGDMNIYGPGAMPKIKGSVDITEGKIQFPSGVFDISQTSMPMDQALGENFSFPIYLQAFSELSRSRYPVKADTFVELNINGFLDSLRFDLKAVSGDKSLDQTRILLLLLGGGQNNEPAQALWEEGTKNQDSSFLPVSSQLFLLPITGELEQWLLDNTQTQVRIQTGLSANGLSARLYWQLNSRLHFEGLSFATTHSFSVQDFGFQLLLYDHLPVGKMLFLESTFLSRFDPMVSENLGNQLKLKYRVWKQ